MKTYKTNRSCQTRLSRVLITEAALGAAILVACSLQAQNTTPPPDSTLPSANISHRAKEFLKEAAQANQTEIATANVAEGKNQF
jgi:predicted outer membrane protein